MSDQAGPRTDQQQTARPAAASGDAVREALEQLRAVSPELAGAEKALGQRVDALLKQAIDPVRANQREFPHEVAYLVQDVERFGRGLDLSPDTRGQMEAAARSAAGLENRSLLNLLSETRDIGDWVLVRDIRRAAGEVGRQSDQDTSIIRGQIDVLLNRTRLARQPEPAAAVASQAQPTNPEQGERGARTGNQASGPTAQAPGRVQAHIPSPGGLLAPAAGQAIMNGVLRGFRALGSANTQPWEPATTPFEGRLNAFEGRLQRDREAAVLRNLEKSGRAALDALRGFQTGEGAVMLNRIREAAHNEPGGMEAVLSQMRPGGKFADLRQQFSNAYADEKGFIAAYDKAALALASYGQGRAAAADVIARQPDATNTAAKFESMDRDIGAAAGEIPSRRDGKTMLQDAGRQIVEIVQRALEGVKNLFSRAADVGTSRSPAPG